MKVHHSRQLPLAAALSLSLAQPLTAAKWSGFSTEWNNSFAWWPDSMPDAPGSVADFTRAYSARNDVMLNGSRTIGTLMLGDTATPIQETQFLAGAPAGGILILDNSGSGVTISTLVSSDPPPIGFNQPPKPANSINVPVELKDDLTFDINTGPATSTSATWLGVVFYEPVIETGGPRSITIGGNGRGMVGFFKGTNITGGCNINAGAALLSAGADLGSGPISVASGAQVGWYNNRILANDLTIRGNGFAQPEGQRGALYFHLGTQTLTGTLQVAANSRIEGSEGTTVVIDGPLTGTSNLEINALNGGNDPLNGASILEKRSGTFQLNGDASGFTGRIAVSRGRLNLGPNSMPGGDLTVSIAGRLGGETTIGGDLTIGTPAPPGPVPILFVDPATSESLHVSGDLELNNVSTVSLRSKPSTETTTVLTYDGTLKSGGPANLELEGNLAKYRTGTGFDTSSEPGKVLLNLVTGSVIWNGGSAAWNSTDLNWVGGDTFHQLDEVTFDDTAPGAVTINDALLAGVIHVNNSAGNDYSIQADGGLTASPTGYRIVTGSLIKDGEGTLDIGTSDDASSNQHTFAGGTTINAGRIRLRQGGNAGLDKGPLGIGPVTMNGGALSGRTLYNPLFINADVTLGESGAASATSLYSTVTLGDNLSIDTPSTVIFGKPNSNTDGLIDGGAGYSLTKTGSGLLELSALTACSWGGSTTVESGEFRVRSALTCGTLSSESGATLSGDGTIFSTVHVESGGILTASNGSTNVLTDTLEIDGDLDLDGSFLCEIDDTEADRIDISGRLDITNASLNLTVLEASANADSVHVIASYGTLSGSKFTSVTGLPADRVLNYAYNDGSGPNHIAITPIPTMTPFQQWAMNQGLVEGVNAGMNDDPNHDGRSNFEHFAFNTDPLGNGSNEGKWRLAMATDGGEEAYFTVTLPVLTGATFSGSPLSGSTSGVLYRMLGDVDLMAPHDLMVVEMIPALASGLPALGDYDGITGADWQYHTFRLSDPMSVHVRAFFKASVEEHP